MQMLKRLRRRLFIFQMFLLVAGSSAVAYGAMRSFEIDLEPDMTRKGDFIARSLAGQFERALEAGIPFARVRGAEDLFASIRSSNREIAFITAIDIERTHAIYDGRADKARIIRSLGPVLDASAHADRNIAYHNVIRWNEYLIVPQSITLLGKPAGFLLVSVDVRYVQQKITDIFYDILIVLSVSLILTFELLLLIMASASAPMLALQSVFSRVSGTDLCMQAIDQRWPREVHQLAVGMRSVIDRLHEKYIALARPVDVTTNCPPVGAGLDEAAAALEALRRPKDAAKGWTIGQHALVRVRMPLFIFFCAEELSRPFFPIYARSLQMPIDGLSPEIVISLPMMLFMLVVALSQPFGGPWAVRLGARRLMAAGAVVGAAGLALTASAESLLALLAWRFVTAAGYGLVFVAGQSHVVANSDAGNRAWGLAMFVGSVLAASICGPAIGGILADRLGYRLTFLVGSSLALLAALLAWRLLWTAQEGAVRQSRPLRLHDIGVVLRNPRFLALIGLGAMPAKIILTGFLYYLAPMYLAELGNSPSAAGRIMMLYGLMMVLMTPLAARVVDRIGRPMLFVVLGGLLSGAGLLGVLWSASTEMVLVGIVVLGLAQAVSITPQLALVPTACPNECRTMGQVTVIGFFRLFERLGSAAGPLLAAFLLHKLGYVSTIVAIGCGVGISCILLWTAWHLCWRQRCVPPMPLQAPTPVTGSIDGV